MRGMGLYMQPRTRYEILDVFVDRAVWLPYSMLYETVFVA